MGNVKVGKVKDGEFCGGFAGMKIARRWSAAGGWAGLAGSVADVI